MTKSLPGGFEALAPFAETWGSLDSQQDRYLLRQWSKMEDLKVFYQAAAPLMEKVFAHLDKYPLEALPDPQACLFRIMLGLTEVAQAVEIFDQPGVPYAPFPHKMDIIWKALPMNESGRG
jgi:hypothetical protein